MDESDKFSGVLKAGLCVYDNLPFALQRFFIIEGNIGDIRGQHAHRKCRQLLLCLDGVVELKFDNGNLVNSIQLDTYKGYFFHDVLSWLTIKFVQKSRILVLAEFPYDETDYIRDYDSFLKEAIK